MRVTSWFTPDPSSLMAARHGDTPGTAGRHAFDSTVRGMLMTNDVLDVLDLLSDTKARPRGRTHQNGKRGASSGPSA